MSEEQSGEAIKVEEARYVRFRINDMTGFNPYSGLSGTLAIGDTLFNPFKEGPTEIDEDTMEDEVENSLMGLGDPSQVARLRNLITSQGSALIPWAHKLLGFLNTIQPKTIVNLAEISCIELAQSTAIELEQAFLSLRLNYVMYPIMTGETPATTYEDFTMKQFDDHIETLYGRLKLGESVTIHCNGDLQRSALMVCCLMSKAAVQSRQPFSMVDLVKTSYKLAEDKLNLFQKEFIQEYLDFITNRTPSSNNQQGQQRLITAKKDLTNGFFKDYITQVTELLSFTKEEAHPHLITKQAILTSINSTPSTYATILSNSNHLMANVTKAITQFKLKNWTSCLTMTSQILSKESSCELAHMLAIHCLVKLKRKEDALDQVRRILHLRFAEDLSMVMVKGALEEFLALPLFHKESQLVDAVNFQRVMDRQNEFQAISVWKTLISDQLTAPIRSATNTLKRPDTTDQQGLNRLGKSLFLEGDLEQAVSVFDEVLELNPKCVSALNNKATALRRLGRNEEALKAYRLALSHNPKSTSAHNGIGLLQYDLKQYPDALRFFDQALRYDPKCVHAHNNKGMTYHQISSLEEALRSYETAASLAPRAATAYNGIGMVFRDMEKNEEAVQAFSKALQIEPNFAMALNNKGMAHKALKQFQEAMDCFNEVLNLDPQYEIARNNKKNLLKLLETNTETRG